MGEAARAEEGTGANKRARLRDLIAELSYQSGRTFTLASGKTSGHFFNMKQSMLHPEASTLMAEMILEVMEREGLHSLGGLEMGAVPLVSAACTRSHGGHEIRAFFVRKQKKDHGAEQQVDGYLAEGDEVMVIDDVVTTGGSTLQAVHAIRARGASVTKALTIVDRLEGARENLAAEGIELIALYDTSDFSI
ncbi:MAG: orotate phosphoribosyltransferase [Pseudomonadota bacterium]